jgi:hypothetical protein
VSDFRRNRKWAIEEKNDGGWGINLAILDSEAEDECPIKKLFRVTKVPKKLSFLSYHPLPAHFHVPVFKVEKTKRL